MFLIDYFSDSGLQWNLFQNQAKKKDYKRFTALQTFEETFSKGSFGIYLGIFYRLINYFTIFFYKM